MSEKTDGNGAAGAQTQTAPRDQRETVPPEFRQPPPGESPQEQRRPPRRPFLKRPLVLLVVGVVVIGGVIVGVLWWLHARQYEKTDDAFVDADVTQVSPRVAGHVVEVKAIDNREFDRDQLLVKLDDAEYKAKYAEAQAAVAAAQSALQQAKENTAAMQAQVGQARAAERAAQTEATRARQELERYQRLSSQAVTQQQLTNLSAAANAAEAQLQAAQQKTIAAQAQVKFAQAQITTAAAQLTQAQEAQKSASLPLSYTAITAPVKGWVTNRSVQAGDYVQVGQALMALVPDEQFVTANFKETQLTDMKPGQDVDITVDAYPGHVFHGKVDSIQRGTGARFSLLPPENATGNYVKVVQRVPVRIDFTDLAKEDPNHVLRPGFSVEPKVWVK